MKSSDIAVSGWSSSKASLAPVRCSNRFSFRVRDLIEVKPNPDWPQIWRKKCTTTISISNKSSAHLWKLPEPRCYSFTSCPLYIYFGSLDIRPFHRQNHRSFMDVRLVIVLLSGSFRCELRMATRRSARNNTAATATAG